jgi:phage baseplate assembly protein W
MAIQRKSRAFKDISLSFSPHPVTKDLPVLTNERAIIRSVRNLVETIPTERFFEPLIGTDIRGQLFENYTLATVTIIEDQIRETIGNFEPRVDNLGVEVNAIPDTNILDVKILFDIRGLDVPTQSFSFILEPTR